MTTDNHHQPSFVDKISVPSSDETDVASHRGDDILIMIINTHCNSSELRVASSCSRQVTRQVLLVGHTRTLHCPDC